MTATATKTRFDSIRSAAFKCGAHWAARQDDSISEALRCNWRNTPTTISEIRRFRTALDFFDIQNFACTSTNGDMVIKVRL